jgi:tRNA(Ile)-lysidine synthase
MSIRGPNSMEQQLTSAWPVDQWRDVHVLAAVSAGPDSVAMLRALVALKQRAGGSGKMVVAHLNHQSRGADSDADQHWLEELCRALSIPLELGRADPAAMAAEQGDGWEAVARAARYDFFRIAAERIGARWVALAHTADDQVETVLQRVLRGTGLAGLAGMPRTRSLSPSVTLVRPLLAVRRAEVLEYLTTIDQEFRHDATNQDTRFTRNRIRHELLPLLRTEFNAQADEALARLAQQAGETQQVIAALVADLVKQSVRWEGSGRTLPVAAMQVACGPLADKPPIVVRELFKTVWSRAGWPLQSMGFDQWQQLADLARGADASPLNLPGDVHARVLDGFVLLRRGAR